MIGLKRKNQGSCPDCNSKVELFQIHIDCAIEMCENVSCDYPFNRPDVEGLIYESPSNDTRYSKKIKTRSSSVPNIVAATKASDVEDNSVKSVKETRPIVLASSSNTQKDKLNLEGQTSFLQKDNTLTDEMVAQNICQNTPASHDPISLPGNIALPPPSAARTAVQVSENATATTSYSLVDIESFLSDFDVAQLPNMNLKTALAPNTNNTQDSTESITDTALSQIFSPVCSTTSPAHSSSTSPASFTSPTSANIETPKDISPMSWMEDMDALFGADMAQSKFDPLGNNDFDSILGL